VMTWICYVGIELSAATQRILLSIEIITLALFAVVALVKVYTGGAPDASMHIGLDWFSPFGLPGGSSALIDGVLLGVFIYWGWDSGVCVNEESEDSANGPGKAAVLSTILLVLIYVVVTASAQAFAGTEGLTHHKNDVLASLGGPVLGSPLDKLLIITVLTSASASTQTTILPTARTTLSMARFGSIPSAFGKISPKHLTPSVSTLVMGGVSLVWTLFIINVSQNVLGDSITGLGFQIAFYYGLTGFACAIYYRRELFRSARNFFMAGVVPFVGGAMLTYIFVKAFIDNAPVDSAYSGGVFGLGAADAIGVGLLLVGVVLMVFANIVYPRFFRRKRETAPPNFLEQGRGPAVDTVTPE
jgi:amino acid transporter